MSIEAEQIQIFYEIAMSIGNSLDLKEMLKISLSALLRKLNCSAGGVHFFQTEATGKFHCQQIFSIPRNTDRIISYQTALQNVPYSLNKKELKKFSLKLPLNGKVEPGSYFHILDLPDLGFVVLNKSGRDLSPFIIKSLIPLLQKLTYACKSCVQNQELNKAHEELKENEDKYRKIFENVQDVFYQTDLGGTIIEISPSIQRYSGFSREELIGKPVEKFYTFTADRKRMLNVLQEKGEVVDFEVRLKNKNGDLLYASVNAHFIYDTDEKPNGVEGSLRDITERKRVNEERKKLQNQIQHAQKLESLGVLAGGIAHDFNNLLMGIMGNASLALRKSPQGSPVRYYIEKIEKTAQQSAELINQLLAYSGKGKFFIQLLNLSELIEEIRDLLKVTISKKVTLHFKLNKDLPPIEGDISQIHQIIVNLIINASEACENKSGIVSVYTGVVNADRAYLADTYLDDNLPLGRYVFLEVSDNGCGMADEIKSKIFDPFFTTKLKGRGLGLAAVLGIVRAHNGAIKVYSESRQGSTFKVLFPEKEILKKDKHKREKVQTVMLPGETILVIDDEKIVRDVVKDMLEDYNINVLIAENGQKGIKLFSENLDKISIVLLDATMPEKNGNEVFHDLRRLCSDVKVILSSGYNEQDVISHFEGKGLAGFIQKPYTSEKLINIITKVLKR